MERLDENVLHVGHRRHRGKPNHLVTFHDRMRIVAARKARGLTPDDVAKHVGIARSTVYRLESGLSKKTPVLVEIYRYLKLPLDLVGKIDPDEEAVIHAFRTMKEAALDIPSGETKVAEFVEMTKRWAATMLDAQKKAQELREEMEGLKADPLVANESSKGDEETGMASRSAR